MSDLGVWDAAVGLSGASALALRGSPIKIHPRELSGIIHPNNGYSCKASDDTRSVFIERKESVSSVDDRVVQRFQDNGGSLEGFRTTSLPDSFGRRTQRCRSVGPAAVD